MLIRICSSVVLVGVALACAFAPLAGVLLLVVAALRLILS